MFYKVLSLVSMILGLWCLQANSQEIDPHQVHRYLSGKWHNQQAVSCLNGSEAKLKPNVILSIRVNRVAPNSNAIRIQVNKQVIPFACFIPKLVEGSFLLTVKYSFDAYLPDDFRDVSVNSSRELDLLQKLLFQANLNPEDIHLILKGVGTKPTSYSLNENVMLMCDPFAALNSPISFPEYFSEELQRSYFVGFQGKSLKLYFMENNICPQSVTVMNFQKL
ncbi:MAG: hypothetical protein KDD40_10300 [Bdellovibrionales bacterium]|nr:hypothetical protein [Bdellovibrionales bacterium]